LCIQPKKSLTEHGDKVTAEEKTAIEADLATLKAALEGEDLTDIQAKAQSLATSAMKLGEAMYKDMQAKEAAGQPETSPEGGEEGNVVEGEFEDVDEEKKQSK